MRRRVKDIPPKWLVHRIARLSSPKKPQRRDERTDCGRKIFAVCEQVGLLQCRERQEARRQEVELTAVILKERSFKNSTVSNSLDGVRMTRSTQVSRSRSQPTLPQPCWRAPPHRAYGQNDSAVLRLVSCAVLLRRV